MLLLNKTLMKLARGSWPWILAIAGVEFLTMMGTTALATAGSAVLAAGFTFLMQLLKGLLEYKAAARARESMRRQIFSKVLELDAGGIEKIGPVSAITASVDAVEQMQAYSYFSSAQQLMSASHSALTAISAAGKVEEALDMDTSRPCDRSPPADPAGFDGIRMEHVSYGYEGRSRALNDVFLTIPRGAVAPFPGFFVSLARILILVCAGVLTTRGTDDPVGTIEFRDVTFAYPGTDKNILEHFSYTVRKGDRVGIAGESGAGKSTILRLLLRFYAPMAGEIQINGIPLEQISFAELHRRIAFLEQDTDLFDATIAENIGIARVLLRDPDVRLMDEPSSALDALRERELLHTLETEYAGKTLPLISHRQSTLAGCTRLLKMEQGKAIPL